MRFHLILTILLLSSFIPIDNSALNTTNRTEFSTDLLGKEVVIRLDNNAFLKQFSGISSKYILETVPGLITELTPEIYGLLDQFDGIRYIEEAPKLLPLLDRSMPQLGVSQSFWGLNQTGSDQFSIAIVDSGIDFTHPAFEGRIIASYNAINNNQSAAIDVDGHGTHVAGIAAGELSISGLYSETSRGSLPPQCNSQGCLLAMVFTMQDVSANTPLDVYLDWGDLGEDFPGSEAGVVIFDPLTTELACEECYLQSGSGLIDETVALPTGSYYIGVTNELLGENEPFEISITYNKTGDTTPLRLTGAAPSANIIPIKVLEGVEGGDLSHFDKAINWIIENRMIYNITVVNLSLGLDRSSDLLDDLMVELVDNGVLPVVAAGNSGLGSNGIFAPASAPETIAVGSTNFVNEVAFYTNVGSDSVNKIIKPDVLAPGGSLATPLANYQTSYRFGFGRITGPDANLGINLIQDDTTSYQGTSMASPHIAGLAYLISTQMSNWNWNSRVSAMTVKRIILSSTYEVANIGLGRELAPAESDDGPTLNRNQKDYHEGWGAVDARAAFELQQESVNIGFTDNFELSLNEVTGQKTKAYRMTLDPDISYAFLVDVQPEFDIDIKIIAADGGPLVDGNDIGELDIISYTTGGLGEDEGLGVRVDQSRDVFVVLTVVDGVGVTTTNFEIFVDNEIPIINILKPITNEITSNPVTVEFSSNYEELKLSIDGKPQGTIKSGQQLPNLSKGDHNLELSATSPNGITSRTSVQFSIREVTTDTTPIQIFVISTTIVTLVCFRRFYHLNL